MRLQIVSSLSWNVLFFFLSKTNWCRNYKPIKWTMTVFLEQFLEIVQKLHSQKHSWVNLALIKKSSSNPLFKRSDSNSSFHLKRNFFDWIKSSMETLLWKIEWLGKTDSRMIYILRYSGSLLASAAQRKPKFWAEESGVFWLRATHLKSNNKLVSFID